MSGANSMEGYLYKKGHALPIMQRRYCVLKGTMLAYYTNADDYTRKLAPRNVLEVVSVRDLSDTDGSAVRSPSKHVTAFEIQYLGGTNYECRADSREEKRQWLAALYHALDEPNRIVADEIEDAQRHLQQEAEKEDRAMGLANDAVEKAQQYADEALALDAQIKSTKTERSALEAQLVRLKILYEEAQKKTEQTRNDLERARGRAHEAAMTEDGEEGDEEEDEDDSSVASRVSAHELMTRISHIAAQLEVDQNAEATQLQEITDMEAAIVDKERAIEECKERAKVCATEGRKLREAAAASLQSAQSAKQLSRLRVSSWTASSSHLDPLAEGYLLCKHPLKPSMHRRYYVLYGNTLCWYKDVDDYNQHIEAPSGVVHVASVAEWTGKVGGMKTFPHAFAIATVEGKTLYCSAPMKQSAVTWDTALHIGLTMPALSPHRAMQAKAHRDSFDLLSTNIQSPTPGSMPRRASLAHIESKEGESEGLEKPKPSEGRQNKESPSRATVIIEGYLVKKSSLFPTMKKKYCILNRLKLGIFESHDQYNTYKTETKEADHEEILVCGVSDWDGHGALLQYHHGFQIHTVNHHMIQCSAANENEKTKWIAGIHEALLKYKDQLLSPTGRQEELLEDKRSSLLARMRSMSDASSATTSTTENFRGKILQVYMENHPAKAHDVPMLMEKYAGRESALVAQLDRIYGTELAQDPEVQELVQSLESATQETRRGRRRLTSGVNSGLRDFGKMTGFLKWTPLDQQGTRPVSPTTASFSVLIIDKLVCYTSETAYVTEPFNAVDTIQLLTISEVATESSTSFCVTYSRADTEGKPPSRPTSPTSPRGPSAVMQLDALTEEQRTLWMAKIRTGLGIVAAHSTSPKEATGSDDVVEAPEAGTEALRRKLILYYRQHNPRRIGEIDTLLHYFVGREKLLLVDLDATYGTSISTDPEYLSLLPGTTQPEIQNDRKDGDALFFESYLWVKHPILGSGFQKCYCVIRNTEWSCFENSRDAHAHGSPCATSPRDSTARDVVKTPLLSDVVMNVNYLNAKLHSMRVFNIEGQVHGAILLRADVEPLFQDWTRALRKAGELQQHLEVPIGEEDMPEWWRALHEKLVEFYQQHHPGKELELANLLRSFEGRERDLLVEIDRLHHTQIAQDPAFLSLLPAPEVVEDVSTVGTTPQETTDAILMEGYLVKRGHLVPSMRKRYCVLIKNVLTYYLTHEDSRSNDSQALGSFRVEIVSDWHGKTTTQTYEYGMELETHDGKTFFCAAFSSEEKTQWIRAFHRGVAIARAEAAPTMVGDTHGVSAPQETEEDRAKRDQFRVRLVEYYQYHNPRKLVDLDLLLACYKGRELVMMEAMDATYGTQLLHDESILRLLPPLNAHTQALRQLEYDGPLERAAGGNSEAAWKHIQSVYVSQKGLTLTFYASREGFKVGAAALTSAADRAVTVLAVKPIEHACRFAVETTEHSWMYFQAPNVLEKAHWLQLLQAALDAMLAMTILEEERLFLAQREGDESTAKRGTALMNGFLMVRIDFIQSLEEFRQHLETLSSSPPAPPSPKRTDDANSSLMKECYVVLRNQNELSLYAEGDRNQAMATLTVLSTRAWKATGGVAPLSSNTSTAGRFPFQILTQEQIILSCGAATDLERAKWIQQIRRGTQQAAAMELLTGQFAEEEKKSDDNDAPKTARLKRRASVVDDSTGERRGYLYYQLANPPKGEPDGENEGFLILNPRASLRIFADESSYLQGEPPVFTLRVVDINTEVAGEKTEQSPGGHFRKLFKAMGNSPKSAKRLVFQLEVVDEDSSVPQQKRLIDFFPATEDEQRLWVSTIQSGINTRKGKQLLSDAKAVLAIEEVQRVLTPAEEEQELVFATSAKEGILALWCSGELVRNVFVILTHCRLLCFASRETAVSCSHENLEQAAVLVVTIDSFADWTPPTDSDSHTSNGFQVLPAPDTNGAPCFFTTAAPKAKTQWLQAIHHELDFALAEKYLDEGAKEFARLAAAHLAATSSVGQSDEASTATEIPSTGPSLRLEGYVRVRHQFIGSMWRERYALVIATSMWLFKDGGDACADDWQRRSIERHELLAAQEWSPQTTASSSSSQNRSGIRLENQDGACLELTFATSEDRDTWLAGITGVLEQSTLTQADYTSRFISRDVALPFVPGAAMEGYLKVRERERSRFKFAPNWKTRYGVLIGTQWLLYETQQQALALHGQNQQLGAAEQKEEGDDVLPQAVVDVAVAEPWQSFRLTKKSTEEDDLETHGFIIVGRKSTAFGVTSPKSLAKTVGDIMECKAQTSLERKRWLNAFEDQIKSAEQEQEMVRNAMEQHKGKAMAHQTVKAKFQTLRDDANRQSLFVIDILASMATDATSSEEEEEEEEEETKDEDPVHGPLITTRSRSMGRVRSPENSPMYRRDLQDWGSSRDTTFVGDSDYGYEVLGSPCKKSKNATTPWWSWQSLFACCFERPPVSTNASAVAAACVPLKNPKYVYEYYHEDKPSSLDDF